MNRSLLTIIFKRFLDIGIIFYLILIPVILATGGIKMDLLGISVKATHAYTPVSPLILLIFIRLLISVEFKSLLLVVTSVCFSLVLVELAIRLWDPPLARDWWITLHKASPVLGWELIPGASGVGKIGELYRINSAGFRDVEHPIEKRTDVKRIAAIGDSFTFGIGVNLVDAYPKQLEQILNRRNLTAKVINFGVVAHHMWQHYETLTRRALRYQPDLVVLGLFTDDLSASIPPYGI